MDAPDLTTYHLVHRAIRQSTRRLAGAVSSLVDDERRDRGRQLARWYAGFEGELHMHHTVEDDFFFPALRQKVPEFGEGFDRIDDDHHRLTELINGTRAALAQISNPMTSFEDAKSHAITRTAELDALMVDHLDFEDDEVLPLFTQHMGAAEYAELEETALGNPKFGQLRFTVPWMMANIDDHERHQVLDPAPLAMKALWLATRRGYRRLAGAALGAEAVPA